MKLKSRTELIWGSPRELMNIFQADDIDCHIITVTNDILKKLELIGYDLIEYSLDTVKMFQNDAVAASFQALKCAASRLTILAVPLMWPGFSPF